MTESFWVRADLPAAAPSKDAAAPPRQNDKARKREDALTSKRFPVCPLAPGEGEMFFAAPPAGGGL